MFGFVGCGSTTWTAPETSLLGAAFSDWPFWEGPGPWADQNAFCEEMGGWSEVAAGPACGRLKKPAGAGSETVWEFADTTIMAAAAVVESIKGFKMAFETWDSPRGRGEFIIKSGLARTAALSCNTGPDIRHAGSLNIPTVSSMGRTEGTGLRDSKSRRGSGRWQPFSHWNWPTSPLPGLRVFTNIPPLCRAVASSIHSI